MATNSLEIENLARFAVDEHNNQANAALLYKKVVNVKQQVVTITLEAVDGGKSKIYEATVVEHACQEVGRLQAYWRCPSTCHLFSRQCLPLESDWEYWR